MKTRLIALLLLSSSLFAEEVITPSGKKVILNSDFTWRYAEETPVKTPGVERKLAMGSDQSVEIKSKSGLYSIWYNPAKWVKSERVTNQDAEFAFQNTDKTAFSMVIFEGLEIPLESFPNLLVINAQQSAPDARIIEIVDCTVNGTKGQLVKYGATLAKMDFVFYSFITSGKKGSIQFTTFTLANRFEQEKPEFERFISGLKIDLN